MAARADAERLLAHEPGARLDDPLEALGQVTVEAIALKDALAARVNALKEIRYSAPGAGTEQLRAELAMYERSLDRVAKFSDALARHDWKGKQIELAQGQAQLVVSAFMAGLGALPGLVPADRNAALRAFLTGLGRGSEVVVGELG